MTTGVSTACLYPLHTETALKKLARLGVGAVEIFINCEEELSFAYLRKMRAVADYYGVKILSVHPYTSPMEPMLFFSKYDRRFDEGLKAYKKYYQAANILGASSVVFHGNIKNAKISLDEYFERFGRLCEDAVNSGSLLCHENVSRCMSSSPDFFKAMSAAIPGARYVFDIKQAVRAGEDVCDFAKAMAGRIQHIHYSDHDATRDCLPPGKGIFNTSKFLTLIMASGFDGGVIVELYRENFKGIVELIAGYQHLFTQISTM